MKLKVASWRLIWRFLVAIFVVYIASFLVLISAFFNITWSPFSISPKQWTYVQPLLIAIFTLLGVGAFIPSLFGYYQIEKNFFLMKRYFREYTFDYSNIEYVDFENSRRRNMVIFYSKTAKMKYLLGDKDGELLKALEKNCRNLLSLEEFRRRHPEEKY